METCKVKVLARINVPRLGYIEPGSVLLMRAPNAQFYLRRGLAEEITEPVKRPKRVNTVDGPKENGTD